MEAKELPARPNLEQYKKQAKELVKACRGGDLASIERIEAQLPEQRNRGGRFSLAAAQFTIAREHGFESWPKFAEHIEALNRERKVASLTDPRDAFLRAASVPRDWHASGTLEEAEAILAAHPEVGSSDIYAAAVLGDEAGVQRFLAMNRANATAKGGPYGWDALTYLCFSRYLRLDRARSAGFVRAAKALLDAGADANTGWMETQHDPRPTWENVIYGAAGLAQNPEMTRLLLQYGADPNDEETAYHAAETRENAALKVLVESGRLKEKGLATILLRKTDWHDYEGLKWMLERGVNPNYRTRWGRTALHNSILRDNGIEFVEALLEHGADPTLLTEKDQHYWKVVPARSAAALAAQRGRGDVLELFERRGISVELTGVDGLIAACARNDKARARAIAKKDPQLVRELLEQGGQLLAQFAGVGNKESVERLLEMGVMVDAPSAGDAYFDVATNSTALHSAAWRARHGTVKLLLEKGAAVNAKDGKGRTPLMLAVRACVDSYWNAQRSPESVGRLLAAGADVRGVSYPSGYAEVDELLGAHGAKPS